MQDIALRVIVLLFISFVLWQPLAFSEPAYQISQTDLEEDKADALYWQGNYAGALPLYLKLVEANHLKSACESSAALHHRADLADCWCRLGKYAEAERQYEIILEERSRRYGEHSFQIAGNLTDLSACAYYQNKYDKAQALSERALRLLERSPTANPDSIAKTHLALAEIYYGQSKYEQAAVNYGAAIKFINQSKAEMIEPLLVSLEGLSACYYHNHDYKQAEPVLRQLTNFERTIYGEGDVRYGWSLNALSDVCRKLGKDDESAQLFSNCVWIFRKNNQDRILAQLEQQGPVSQVIKENLTKYVLGESANRKAHTKTASNELLPDLTCLPGDRSLAKPGPWNLMTSDQIAPPGWIWLDPNLQQKAIVVCIHGLGLNAQSYSAFAQAIAHSGYMTIAFDVRGFGSYLASKGREKVDFAGCLQDLSTVLKEIHQDNPGLPVFLLGESMGGAIALQLTALHPELVNGLICSVPAGSRYKAPSTTLEVAVRLVKGKNMPFDIGSKIVNQASTKSSVRAAWQNDPFDRLMLSPVELVEFQEFMNQNKSAAFKIKNTPVIIFQGVQDKLVKAAGTLQIFKDLSTTDKDMVLVGALEHLIFESNEFSKPVISGVLGWMAAHLPEENKL
jgi:alpha-beta hydrolase superfamily lysophospholipase